MRNISSTPTMADSEVTQVARGRWAPHVKSALLDVALTLMLTTGCLAVLVGGALDELGNPFRAGGDPLSYAATSSSLDWTSHAVGYPFGMTPMPYFPTLDFTQRALADAVSQFTDNPFLPGNVVWLVSYLFTAMAAWWVFRLAGARRPTAIALAISFAFIPYHAVRALTHLYLATTWPAVLAVGLALLVGMGQLPAARDSARPRWRRIHGGVILISVVVAFSGIYYAFFALLLLAMALAWRFARGADLRSIVNSSYPAVLICCLMLTALTLQAVSQAADPPVAPVVTRNAGESAIFAGSMSLALTPSPKSDLPIVSELTRRSSEYLFESEGFTYGQYGTVVSTGCGGIFLLGMPLLARRAARRADSGGSSAAIDGRGVSGGLVLALLTGSVMFFSPWSLNFLFALFVTPGIRSWNRLLPIILLLLMCGAVSVARLAWRPGRVPVLLIAAAILVLTLFDSVTPYRPMISNALSRSAERVKSAKVYATSVNAVTPERCGVLQLPYVAFPESPRQGQMEEYEHFLVALANPEKYWSYGGVKKTTASVWAERLQDDIDESAIQSLREAGFCGIHVDRHGYEHKNADALVARLERLVGEPKARGAAGRWLYFGFDGVVPLEPESFDPLRLSPAAQRFFATS